MFSRLLVPVDGSAPSDAAVDLAIRLARDRAARLDFLHVVDVARLFSRVEPSAYRPALQAAYAAGRQMLDDAAARAEEFGIKTTAELAEGSPVNTIVELARALGCDLIVIGSHGRSGIAHAFLGSVAEGVMRRAEVPVLITRAIEPAERRKLKEAAVAHVAAGARP